MNVVLFLVNNGCLLIFAYIVTFSRNEKGVYTRILEIFTVYIIEILAVVLTAGLVLESLNFSTLTALSLLLLAVAFVLIKVRKLQIKVLLNHLARESTHRESLKSSLFNEKFILIIFFAVGATLIFKIFSSIFLIQYSYDSTSYHLPGLVDYIQQGKIYLSEKLVWSNSYPRNTEMLSLWNLIYFKDGMFVKLVQYFLTLFGSVAFFGILKEAGIEKKYCFTGALLFLSTPIVLAQMSTSYIDTSIAAVLIGSVYFMMRFLKEKKAADLVYMAMLLGFMLGSKYSSAALFLVVAVIFFFIQLIYKEKVVAVIKTLFILGLISAAIGGIWYILNYINFSNPVYPFKLSVFGRTIFEGFDTKSYVVDPNLPAILKGKSDIIQILISWIGVGSSEVTKSQLHNLFVGTMVTSYDQSIGGLGFQWITLLFPASIILVVKRIRERVFDKTEIAMFSIIVLSFIVSLGQWQSRYTCFILLPGIYSFIVLLNANKNKKSIFKTLITVFVIISCLQGSLFDAWFLTSAIDVNKDNPSYNYRSTYVQLNYSPSREIYARVNDKAEGYDITCFGVNSDLYNYQGDNTQNRLKTYQFEQDKYMTNYNTNTYKRFYEIIKANKADLIIITPQFQGFINTYMAAEKDYKLVAAGSDQVSLYEK